MMKKSFFIFALILTLFSGLSSALAYDYEAKISDYEATPFWVAENSIPQVLLILAKDYKMFYQAYAGLIVDMDGDGRVDTGFNPRVEYKGYFDSRSCYVYNGNEPNGDMFMTTDENGIFKRVAPTVEDDNVIARPSGLKGYIPSYRSTTGICRGVTSGGKKTFSGNWLNFMVSSRMDVIRKILYGGDRKVDALDRTELEPSFIPPDAAVWGTDILADDIWNRSPYNSYYDITKYTPFNKPKNGKAHYFARVRSVNSLGFASLRVAINVNVNSDGRYWDWVMQSRPVPHDKQLKTKYGGLEYFKSYRVRVSVCEGTDPDNMEDPSYGCQKYRSGYYKPIGLLQEYGSNDKMFFGLMTGGYGRHLRENGGIIRNHIDSMSKSINENTGQLIVRDAANKVMGGIPWSISQMRITGRNLQDYDINASCYTRRCLYSDYNSWGNPLGEMLYEGVRYMANRESIKVTSAFYKYEEGDTSDTTWTAAGVRPLEKSTVNYLKEQGKELNDAGWNKRPKFQALNCPKPVILLISDIDSSYDGDIPNNNDLNGFSLMPGIKEANVVNLPDQFTMDAYLDIISQNEAYDSISKFAISKGRTDDCSAKPMSSLKEVKGICPQSPSYEGTYSAAAVAYYAHTHNFSTGTIRAPIDIYAVTMSAAFPELTFPIKDSSGKVIKQISVLPVNNTILNNSWPYFVQNTDRILSYLNYFLYDWQLDRNGTPFKIIIRVNFSDRSMGDDWEMDVVEQYTVSLLAKSSVSPSKRSPCAISSEGENCNSYIGSIVSGAFRNQADNIYYFKNPDDADSVNDFIEIHPDEVAGLSVDSNSIVSASGGTLGVGYTIMGTDNADGTYIDVAIPGYSLTPGSRFNTPPSCPRTGGPASQGCGKAHGNKRQIRTFLFAESNNIKMLPNPLWLAAKYGGFHDANRNGFPEDDEWKRGGDGLYKDDPANYFQAANISDLAEQLGKAFQAIADSALTGTANSASINSILGGGLSIQTQFHTQYEDPSDKNNSIIWAGSVYSLFVDKWGNLREDTNGNKKLDLATGHNPGEPTGDRVVEFKAVEGDKLPSIILYDDPNGDNNLVRYGEVDSAEKLNVVWGVSRWLSSLADEQVTQSRSYNVAGGRRVYTYFGDHSADGSVDWPRNEHMLSANLFNKENAKSFYELMMMHNDISICENLVDYILGVDFPGQFRNRTVVMPWSNGEAKVWRLGDVMNSKPIIVGEAASNYHLLYNDESYREYRKKVGTRRQVAYFGSNDGILHAINMGFYGSLKDGQAGYSTQPVVENSYGATTFTEHELGAELWGYVPTSVLPHLQWLADTTYKHSYYVDMKPYIVDVKDSRINDPSDQWRTVMIVGLRLGGHAINIAPIGEDPRYSYSEFFALDITNPEEEPVLLWRYSHDSLGLTTASPAVVRSGDNWYAVLPSGPTDNNYKNNIGGHSSLDPGQGRAYDGVSPQSAKVFIIDALTGKEKAVLDSGVDYSFFNDTFTPRADIKTVSHSNGQTSWSNHTVYFGMTSREIAPAPSLSMLDTGAVYRLKMLDPSTGNPLDVSASAESGDGWQLTKLIDVERPVSGAINSTYDNLGNLWVIFGTGRLWGRNDMLPCGSEELYVDSVCSDNHSQYIYGVKEPLNADGRLTYLEVANDEKIADVSRIEVYSNDSLAYPSSERPFGENVQTHNQLLKVMTDANNDSGVLFNGYRRKLESWRLIPGAADPGKTVYEVVVTQPKIDGLPNGLSNTIFTSYLPSQNICDPSGESYLQVMNSFTGLPAGYMSQYGFAPGKDKLDENDPPNSTTQVTGIKKAGDGMASEAWILKTGEGTIYGNTSVNSARNTIFLDILKGEGSNMISWREVLDMGFQITNEDLKKDLVPGQ